MSETATFYEIVSSSLKRHGEEVCGDQVKSLRTPDQTLLVLSDGLGSGIKANILARLTTEIIVAMLRERAPLADVIDTVMGTLPVCRERGLAYATFAIVQIQHADGGFQLVSFDGPPPVLLKSRRRVPLELREQAIGGKCLKVGNGILEHGDFLGLMSDGVLYADQTVVMDPRWGWEEIAALLEREACTGRTSAGWLVRTVMDETQRRYGGMAGDDATFVGLLARRPRRLVVLTGPPLDKASDEAFVTRFLRIEARHVICGGTTSNIVADHLGEVVRTDRSTQRDDLPAVGDLSEVELVTEGILTLARTLEMLRACGGDANKLQVDRNAAVLLAREFLQADSIQFMVGESVNPYYQNPQLPRSVSIRRSLVTQIADVLTALQKEVKIEWK